MNYELDVEFLSEHNLLEEGATTAVAIILCGRREERTAERGASGGQPARKEEERAARGWGRNDRSVLVGLTHGEPRRIPPARYGSGPAEAANPDHTSLVYDDPGVVAQQDSGCDSPEQLAYAALAWEGRSAGLDTGSDSNLVQAIPHIEEVEATVSVLRESVHEDAPRKARMVLPVLGYWDIRGKAQMIRNLLVYKDVVFVDKRYSYGAPPDYAGAEWQADKFSLGLKFPNLPFTTVAEERQTRLSGRRCVLASQSTEEEVTQLDLLEQQALDLQKKLAQTAFDSNWEEARKKYETSFDNELRPWNEFLHGRAWALGGRLTYVDFMLHEALDWIRDFKPEAFQRFPTLLKYLNEFEELPNIKQYMASEKYRKHPFMRRKWSWGVKKTSCQF
ncbi:hypothetical protein HPB47_024449 [Ixodes persulcatus]|uniref:Uncharacterized protein n=1 Tax=Ixodes persulcatus TaxID=34615 RepID=A0AC60Q5F0_IXOPE|nr:hypothetical protein HPB47_024449 [Ixodes persulcatus]